MCEGKKRLQQQTTKGVIVYAIRELFQYRTNIGALEEDSANNGFLTSIKLAVFHLCCETCDSFQPCGVFYYGMIVLIMLPQADQQIV